MGFGNLVFILFTNPSLQNSEVPVDFRKDSDTTQRRYPNGESYPAWFEIDHISAALGEGAKLSFHLNETAEYRDLVIFAKLSWVEIHPFLEENHLDCELNLVEGSLEV